tara:strand:- start:199 stop:678 length:480 start_codon:yes stop_codon:yes gene_type:complete
MTGEIKQFKLTNDDEIICEVVEWDDEASSNIVVRRALKIINVEDYAKGVRFFAFRPWMLFNDDPDELHTINAVHIIGEMNPAEAVIARYMTSVVSIANQSKKKEFSLDDVAQKAEAMDEEEFDEYMHNLTDDDIEISYDVDNGDSDSDNNVIKFKPRLH